MNQFWIGVAVGVAGSAALYFLHVGARLKALEDHVRASLKAKL